MTTDTRTVYAARLDAERAANIEGEKALGLLQDRAGLQAMIVQFGEDSLAVSRLRHQQERDIFVEQTNSTLMSEQLKLELIGAWDAANGIAQSDMAGAIAGAASEAQNLSAELGISLGLAIAIANKRHVAERTTGTNNNGLDSLDPRNPNNTRDETYTGPYGRVSPFDPRRNPVRKKRKGGGGGSAKQAAQDRRRVIDSIAKEMDSLAPSYERDVSALDKWRAETLASLNPAKAGFEEFAADVSTIYDEKLAEAYERDLQRRTDWAAGVERAFAKVNDDMMTWANVGENIATKWTSGLEDAFVEMSKTGKISVGDLVDYTLEQLQRLAYQSVIQPGIESGFGFLSELIGGMFSGGGGGFTAVQSHSGSQIGTGGVRRTYGPGAPLRADERLTVTTLGQRVFTPEQISNGATVVDALAAAASAPAQNGGATVFSPKINIINQSSAQVSGEVKEESDGSGERSYSLILADQIGVALTTPGGGAKRTMASSFGLKKKRALR